MEKAPDAPIGLLEPGGRFADPDDYARSVRMQPAKALQDFAGECTGTMWWW